MQSGPAMKFTAVTPSDVTELPSVRGLWIGTSGDLVVDDGYGNIDITFKNVPDGTLIPIAVLRVKDATTAADIVALQ